LPFLQEESIYDHLKPLDNRLFLDRYFPLYKYHGYADEFKEGLTLFLGGASNKKYTEFNGYEAKDKLWNSEFKQMRDTMKNETLIHPPHLIKEGFDILDGMIKDCQEEDIELVLIFTPQYKGFTDLQTQVDGLIQKFSALAKKENVHFINYVDEPLCSDTANFYNAMHLNKIGAEMFTKMLAEDLEKLNLN